MEREALLKLVGTVIDAGSAAAVNGKLLQIAKLALELVDVYKRQTF